MKKLNLFRAMMSLTLLTALASAGSSETSKKMSALDELAKAAGPTTSFEAPLAATPKVCSFDHPGLSSASSWITMPTSGNVDSGSGMTCDSRTLYPTALNTGYSSYKFWADSEIAALYACTQLVFNDPQSQVPPGFTPIDCPRCPHGFFGCHSAAKLVLSGIELKKQDPNCQQTPQHPYCQYICRTKIRLPSSVGTSSVPLWPIEFMCTRCN